MFLPEQYPDGKPEAICQISVFLILVDIADYYDISIPEIINGERKSEIMNEEERKIAKTM